MGDFSLPRPFIPGLKSQGFQVFSYKMSNYCRGCRGDRTVRSGENACPFNFFYWDFLARHRDKLQSIGRMSFILANLDKMPPEELATIRQKAADWHLVS